MLLSRLPWIACAPHRMLICWRKDEALSLRSTMVRQLHEVLLSKITVAGMHDPPAEVRALFESFLRQLSLPRLVHFFDLVLAQMIPRWETSAGQARSRLVCHVMRLWNDAWHRGVQRPFPATICLQSWNRTYCCPLAT